MSLGAFIVARPNETPDNPLGSFARRLALPHDVERDRSVAMFRDLRLDDSDVLGRDLSTSGVGEHAVVA